MLALMVGVVTLHSCDLDLQPRTSIAIDESKPMITSMSSLKYFRNGLYSTFRSIQNGPMCYAGDLMCDDFNAVEGFGNRNGDIHRTDNSFTAANNVTSPMWSWHFSSIKDYNVFLSQIDKFEAKTDEEIQTARIAKGEAHLFRACAYLNMVRYFAPAYSLENRDKLAVPLVLKYDQMAQPERNTVGEIYDQIKKDIDAAADGLADVPGKLRSMFATIDCVYQMYSRYYLDIGEYEKAAEYAEKIINSGVYELASGWDAFYQENTLDNGTEPLMQVAGDKQEYTGGAGMGMYTGLAYDSKNFPPNEFFSLGLYLNPDFVPSQSLIDSYNMSDGQLNNDDLRFMFWFNNSYFEYKGKIYAIRYPMYINSIKCNHPDKFDFYPFMKHIGNPGLANNALQPNGKVYAKPFRLNEVYLDAAEAYARLGKNDRAAEFLNSLQSARGAELSDGSMESVKLEWRREMVGDGYRMICLKRWHDGFDGRPIQNGVKDIKAKVIMRGENYDEKRLDADAYQWVWPVPDYEMKVNENLVQNPGYENAK